MSALSDVRAALSQFLHVTALLHREVWERVGGWNETFREGAEDYEYFAILRDRVADLEARGESSAALQAAKKLLAEGRPDRNPIGRRGSRTSARR